MNHPQAIQPLLELATELREHHFPVSPEQTMLFIQAVQILGPDHIDHIKQAALACLSIDPDRRFEFEAIFRNIFYGQSVSAQAQSSDDDDVDAFEPAGADQSIEAEEITTEFGRESIDAERLSVREFSQTSDIALLRDFERKAPTDLPHRRSYRWRKNTKGSKIDLRATLRSAVSRDGEIVELEFLKRKLRQRRILLLIDISGSMKERSGDSLRFAHSLVQVAESVEVFTLGTRLTRVTSALSVTQANRALDRVSKLVADFDGGTRIGDAFQAYLRVPRYSGYARGAAVVVLSDGLERGDSEALTDAARHLSQISWRFNWLTPLAVDPEFEPQTDALQRILPYLDDLSSGHSVAAMCSHVLNMAKAA